jgi:hypothetical protein
MAIFDKENNPKGLPIRLDIFETWIGIPEEYATHVVTTRYRGLNYVANYVTSPASRAREFNSRTSIFNLRAWGRQGYQVEVFNGKED